MLSIPTRLIKIYPTTLPYVTSPPATEFRILIWQYPRAKSNWFSESQEKLIWSINGVLTQLLTTILYWRVYLSHGVLFTAEHAQSHSRTLALLAVTLTGAGATLRLPATQWQGHANLFYTLPLAFIIISAFFSLLPRCSLSEQCL